MSVLSARERRAVGWGVLAVIVTSVWLMLGGPASRARDAYRHLDAERVLMQRERLLVASFDLDSLRVPVIDGVLAASEPLLASVELAGIVEGLARLAGLRVDAALPGVGGVDTGIGTVLVDVRGEGDFEGFVRLLDYVESHDLVLVAQSLELAARAHVGARQRLGFRLVVMGFHADSNGGAR